MMNKTGRFKTLMNICGIFPAVAGILIAQMSEDSGFVALWLSIVSTFPFQYAGHIRLSICYLKIPLGFGNAAVLQTALSELILSR